MASVLRQFLATTAAPSFQTRQEYFQFLASQTTAQHYWEFGVHEGASITLALKSFQGLDELHGFDSFEGLPTSWTHGSGTTFAKGHFDVGGQVPHIEDARVTFHKGWFEDVLPNFLAGNPTKGADLIVHFDADLHDPTEFVLNQLTDRLEGALLMFDEWTGGEARALEHWLTAHNYRFEVVAWVPNVNHGLPVQVAGFCVRA